MHFKLLLGDLDQALPLPISRHFVKEYSRVNSNITYIEMPRTGHTPAGWTLLFISKQN